MSQSYSPFRSQGGQATVELMIILPLLLILLAVSISIFSQQMIIVDSLRYRYAVERSAEFVSEALTQMSHAPPGSAALFTIPKSPEVQDITMSNGFVEVKGSISYSSVLLPSDWNGISFTANDGDTFSVSVDNNNVLHVQVAP